MELIRNCHQSNTQAPGHYCGVVTPLCALLNSQTAEHSGALASSQNSAMGVMLSLQCSDWRGYSSAEITSALAREMHIRSTKPVDDLQNVKIPWILWDIPQDCLEDADITQLMWQLGRRLPLASPPDVDFQFSCSLETLNADRLALFRGLGFNHLRLQLPSSIYSNKLIDRSLAMIADFRFDSWSLLSWQPSPDIHRLLPKLEDSRAGLPTAIHWRCLPHTNAGRELFDTLLKLAEDYQYLLLGNDWLVKSKSRTANAFHEKTIQMTPFGYNGLGVNSILAFGPGAESFGLHNTWRNASVFANYRDSEIPNQPYTRPSHTQQLAMARELMCFHKLEIPPYGTALAKLLTAWQSQTLVDNTPLYSEHDNQIKLTQQGIFLLSDLLKPILYPQTGDIFSLPAVAGIAE